VTQHRLFRSRRAWLAAAFLAVVLLLGFCFLVRRWQTPPDHVVVTINNNDPAVKFVCLLAETHAGPETLLYSWHYAYDLGVQHFHPNRFPATPNGNAHTMDGVGSPTGLAVSWKEAERYGVLTWDGKDDWRVWWFDREEVSVLGSHWLFGGGRVTIDLLGEGKRADPELLDRVGFGPELRDRWRAVPVKLLSVAGIRRRRGQYAGAVKVLQEFLAGEENGQDRAIGLFLLATCQARLGETAKAEAAYEEAERWVTANSERVEKDRRAARRIGLGGITPLEGFQWEASQALQEARQGGGNDSK
jgi:hypothetical protein